MKQETKEIPLEKIVVGEHDRRLAVDEESVADLMGSIKRVGLTYPLIVKRQGEMFLVLDGHTRLEALKRLNLTTARCSITDTDEGHAAEIAFGGNFFRKQMTPVELASAIKDVLEAGQIGIEEIARGFNRSEHWVHEMLAICAWPSDVQLAMHMHKMSIAAASNLACVTDDVYRDYLLRNAVEGGVSARTTAAWLMAWRQQQPAEQAITSEPVGGAVPPLPAVPQGPCFICSEVHLVNEMSHVPLCGGCIKAVRTQT